MAPAPRGRPPLARYPLARRAAALYARRPFLVTWLVLAAGMVAMLLLFSRDAGLTPRQAATLVVVTAGCAWLCTWIIFLEHAGPDQPDSVQE